MAIQWDMVIHMVITTTIEVTMEDMGIRRKGKVIIQRNNQDKRQK